MIFISPMRVLLRSTVIRYAIAGATASCLEVVLLYLFTEFGGVYYLLSAVAGTTIAFFVRFSLQKLFAFQNKSLRKLPQEIGLYGLLYIAGTSSTVGLLYVFTELAGLWYVASQIIAILIVASVSFFVYRYIIFPIHHAETL